jgi:hypothetical protein
MVTQEVRIHVLKQRRQLALVQAPSSDVASEHAALLRMLAGAQARVTGVVVDYQAQIYALQAQIIRLRARVIVRDTLLAWLRETLAQREPAAEAAEEDLQAHHAAADRVICQTGCISHGGYWREDEQCRRTGKSCTMEESKVEIPR